MKLLLIIETFESDLKTAILVNCTACSGNVSRRFGMAYRYQFIEYRIHIGPNFKGQEYKKVDSWSMKLCSISGPKAMISDTQHDSPEEHRSYLIRGGSLKSESVLLPQYQFFQLQLT